MSWLAPVIICSIAGGGILRPSLKAILIIAPCERNTAHNLKEALSLCAHVYTYTRQLNSFRAPTLWFMDLTVATCHIQYTFLGLCHFFMRKRTKHKKYLKSAIFIWYENGHWWLLGAQSINIINKEDKKTQTIKYSFLFATNFSLEQGAYLY